MDVTMRNIGSFLGPKYAASGNATAAGTGDNTKVTGEVIDLMDRPSGVLVIGYETTLTEAKTLKFAVEHTDSADNSSYGTAVEDQAATTAATGGTGGSTVKGVVTINVDCSGAKRYRKYAITPDLSHSGTDTVRWVAVFVPLKSQVAAP